MRHSVLAARLYACYRAESPDAVAAIRREPYNRVCVAGTLWTGILAREVWDEEPAEFSIQISLSLCDISLVLIGA